MDQPLPNPTPTTFAPFARRRFLRGLGITAAGLPLIGGMVAAACGYDDPTGAKTSTAPESLGVQPTPTAVPAGHNAHAAIDMGHKDGVTRFLENTKTAITKGKGNVPLPFTVDGGVKVFRLTVDEVEWEGSPGSIKKALGYNSMLPGPIIRATEGDRVRVIVTNNLPESTTIHWHGLLVPNNQDGVPYINQEPIQPGATFAYEFPLRNSGSHMYHSHHNAFDQVNRGLLGAFIVDPKDPATYPKYDREHILILNDTSNGFTINGKGFPATDALIAKKGERVLIRFMNEGIMHHPMHLHGMPMLVFAVDGYPLPQPYLCDTLDMPPGNRYDVIVEANEVGAWAFHCHVLTHAESAQGMFGMVTALVVTE